MKTPYRHSGGLTLLEILVIVVIIVILAALLLPAIPGHGGRRNGVIRCSNNLSQLWKMQNVYMSKFWMKLMPAETGSDFWLKLTKSSPPLVDTAVAEIFSCPCKPGPAAPGDTHYRGPTANVNSIADGDPVGGDGPSGLPAGSADAAHPGEGRSGNIVRKSGDVCEYADKDWAAYDARITY